MKKIFAVTFILTVLMFCNSFAENEITISPEMFTHYAEVEGPLAPGSFYRARILVPVIRSADGDLRDLRLFDGNDKEIQFVILGNSSLRKSPVSFVADITDYSNDGSRAVIKMNLGKKPVTVKKIILDIQEKDFQRSILLEGSADGNNWSFVTEGIIFDFSSRVNLRKTEVEFKPVSYSQFRLTLTNTDESRTGDSRISLKYDGLDFSISGKELKEPKISRISFLTPEEEGIKIYDESEVIRPETYIDKSGNTLMDIESSFPLEKVTLSVSDSFYYRNVRIYRLNEKGDQSFSAEGYIYSFPVSGISETRDWLDCRIQASEKIRIEIVNGDNPPLSVENIKFQWTAKSLFFMASQSEGDYRLYFGNDTVRAPRYELARFIRKDNLHEHDFNETGLSEISVNERFKKVRTPEERTSFHKKILTAAVLFFVVILAFWLFRIVKREKP